MGDDYPVVKLAAVQAAPVFLEREATVAKACRLILEAGRNGAKVVAFPEGFIPGFPQWFWFYKVGSPEAKQFYRRLFQNAVAIPSPAVDELAAAAREAGCYVVIGITEKEPGSLGTLYNTALYLGPDGRVLGKHRKLVPTAAERLVYGPGDGSTLGVVETDFGPLGSLICGENTISLARYTLLALGERIHVALWPGFAYQDCRLQHDAIDFRCRNHAFEGKVFVISATGLISEEIRDELCRDENDRRLLVSDGGHSSIIDPRGQFIAGPLAGGERILYADADLAVSVGAKSQHDVLGHYNRFDIFELRVNRRARPPIRFVDDEAADRAER
jgi:nitrilase